MLQPVTIVPPAVSIAAPTLNLEKAACARRRAVRAAAISSTELDTGIHSPVRTDAPGPKDPAYFPGPEGPGLLRPHPRTPAPRTPHPAPRTPAPPHLFSHSLDDSLEERHERSADPSCGLEHVLVIQRLRRHSCRHVGNAGKAKHLDSHVARGNRFRDRRHAHGIGADGSQKTNLCGRLVTGTEHGHVNAVTHRHVSGP